MNEEAVARAMHTAWDKWWMDCTPSSDPRMLSFFSGYQAALAAMPAQGWRNGVEAAAKVCEEQQAVFGSKEYAVNQPFSSFQERFACGQCAKAIRALTPPEEK